MRDFAIPERIRRADAAVAMEPLHQIDYRRSCRQLDVPVFSAHIEHGMPSIRGIFDTGASSVCLKTGIPERWGMTSHGKVRVQGANGTAEATVWRGDIKLAVGKIILVQNICVWETHLPGTVDALIGQPIIKLFKFIVWPGFRGVTLKRPKV